MLHGQGLPVPEIYGYLADPPCIVMEAIEGTRDFSALDAATKSVIGRVYMQAVAAMHRLPVEPFMAAGVHRPEGAEAIALVGLDAYMPHYRRTKSRPEPLLEFVIGWLRRNVPRHRDRASFIQFDSGQYLVDQGAMTKLYDFEFSMIGDPLVDIATMGMRDSFEPLGAPLAELVGYYEEATGEPVDHDAVLFHVLHHDELTFDFSGMVKFVDLELDGEMVTQTEDIRRGYLDALEQFENRLEEICQRNRIERVVVDTSRDMGEVFVDYLNQRSLLNRGR